MYVTYVIWETSVWSYLSDICNISSSFLKPLKKIVFPSLLNSLPPLPPTHTHTLIPQDYGDFSTVGYRNTIFLLMPKFLPPPPPHIHTYRGAIVTVSTVGYGDIVAANHTERIFVIFVGLIGGMFFAFSLGNINSLISATMVRSVLQCCSVLQCVAVCCSVLQCVAVTPLFPPLWYTASHRHCHTLQHTATHCHTLSHTATHCNTLQHTATHCNTL